MNYFATVYADIEQIVEKVNIANARGRAKVRFGKNELANSIFQDIKDGIRPNISFGYEVLSMEKVKNKSIASHIK